jgi:hypothetical protein
MVKLVMKMEISELCDYAHNWPVLTHNTTLHPTLSKIWRYKKVHMKCYNTLEFTNILLYDKKTLQLLC